MKYFDLHCDTATECFETKQGLYSNNLQLSIEKGLNFEKWVQVYAIWMNDERRGEAAYEHFCMVYDHFMLELNKNADLVKVCTDGAQIEKVLEQGKRVAMLAIEGSAALGGKVSRVQEFYDKGIRFMTLTWNGKCEVADGCMVEKAEGLTEFGKKVVNEMNRVGMIVDVSHLAEKGFWDIVNYSDQPFIATHSNSQTVCPHPRNLSDEAFKEIVKRKGLVGMNFYPMFINGTTTAIMAELIPHITHFLELGGEDVIALGSDFDGATMPSDLESVDRIGRLYDKLTQYYGPEITNKIFFRNCSRFLGIIK